MARHAPFPFGVAEGSLVVSRQIFERPPKLGTLYRRALFRRRPDRGLVAIPRIEAELTRVVPTEAALATYRRVTQDPSTERTLPICYPHVIASPLHAALLAMPEFPYKILGLVHVENVITQHRPIAEGEPLRVVCVIEGAEEAKKGISFDVQTEVTVDGERVWESASKILRIRKGGSGKSKAKRPPHVPGEAPGAQRSVIWRLPGDLGRQYAGVSGDYNPIHLWPVTAKLFGFKRPIIHGMWSLARCLTEIEPDELGGSCTLSVRFKRPVLLPGRVLMTSGRDETGVTFRLASTEGRVPHLEGRLV